MFNKVKSVIPQKEYVLYVEFKNGEGRFYDVKLLFEKWDVFRDLQDIPGLFDSVKADAGGYGISWNDFIDLSCDELWVNGFLEPFNSAGEEKEKGNQYTEYK